MGHRIGRWPLRLTFPALNNVKHMIRLKFLTYCCVVYTLVALSLPGCLNSPMTSLCSAIVAGDLDRAMQLVEQGADVNAGSGCAMYAAASRGQVELVKLLLEHKADPNGAVSGDLSVIMGASTPLEAAVISGNIEVVKMLLEYGADPRNDLQAFTVVINFGHIEMADLLLRNGADPNMPHPPQKNIYAYEKVGPRHTQMVIVPPRDLEPDRIDDTAKQYQCDMSGPESLLYMAIHPGSPEGEAGRDSIVTMFLDRGADPNVRTISGETPLMLAASQQDHHAITKLIRAGADIHATDRCGRTTFDYVDLYPDHQRANLASQTKALLREHQQN